MKYIIDANNLAGKLDLLSQSDFDKKFIQIIKRFFKDTRHKVVLVFDSSDLMGDKYVEGNLTVVYTPQDSYYNGADDKVLELVDDKTLTELSPEASGLSSFTVITDDLELRQKIEKINEKRKIKIELIRSSDFKNRLLDMMKTDPLVDEKTGLSKNEVNDINSDLLNQWKKL